jgi:cytoskeletal protein CcmA (bactofilin family)
MFSKGNKQTAATTPEPKTVLKSGIPSIISADMKIIGAVESAGDIQIDGVIEGDVSSRTLTVSDTATVRGSISADTIRVAGTVKGGINAKSVTLTRSAKVEGDILHQALAIESGANFEGQCRRMDGERIEPQKIALLTDGNAERRADPAVVGKSLATA